MNERDYQITHIDQTVQAVSEFRKIIAQLPTGGGKTVEFSLICKRYISNTTKSVLILVHREELLHQAARTIHSVCGFHPYLITSKTKKFYLSRVYIGMVDSTLPRLDLINNVGLVIIDECHIANFNKMHEVFLEELIIGFSATPKSSSKKDPLNKYYHSIVVGPQISELIAKGFLAQNITRCPKDIVDNSKFEVDKLKGDYNEKQMAAEYKKPKFITNVVQNYFKYCKKQKTIIFNVSIEHSKEVTECFVTCGFNARHLDGNASEQKRAETLKWFKETEDAILCNVMIATVGFDEPTIRNVILNFSTLSVVKFIQCAGRGGRIIDDFFIKKHQHEYPYTLSEKKEFNIIDMGGNCLKFGDWNEDRDWKYIFEQPDKPGNGVAPVKTCPVCDALVHASTRVCTYLNDKGEVCMHEFEKKKTPVEGKDSEDLVIITKGLNIPDLTVKYSNKYDYYLFDKLAENVVNDMFTANPRPTDTLLMKAFETYYSLCVTWWDQHMANKDGNIKDITNSPFHIRRARSNFNKLIKQRQLSIDF